VATENAVKVDPLLIVFVSASPPMNPMRVSLLRYMVVFPQEREVAAPKARSCFSGGTRMGEPEPERRRQTKQKLRRPQGAGIWPEAVPRTEGQIRIMTFLDAPLQVSSEQTTTMIDRKNRLPIRNAAGIELVGKRKKPMNWVNLGIVKLAVVCH
jgi:hypothetical protein